MTEKEIKNRRIIIKDAKDNQTIADTKIIRYNSEVNSVYISAPSMPDKKIYQVYAVIFTEKGLYNFCGSIRGVIRENEMEVFLGKCETKEDRKAVRYLLSFEGSMEGVYIGEAKVMFRRAIPIETIDMSSNGILLKAGTGFFRIGEKYSLLLKINGDILKMQCEIVRTRNDGTLAEEYGCRIEEVQWDQGEETASGEVMVCEDTYLDTLADEYESYETRQKIIEEQTGYEKMNQDISFLFHSLNKETGLNKEKMKMICQEIAYKLIELDPVAIFECISLPRPVNEELQSHSLNTAFLNGIQAKWLNMSLDQIERFILAGLLHNAEKMMIPEEVLNEAEYPDGVREEAIELCTKITAISDAYDSAVSAKNCKSTEKPLNILHMFYKEEFEGLDRVLVMNFIKNMRLTYTGRQAVMSNGRQGIIRYIPFNDAEHPVVQQGTRIEQTNEEWFCKAVLLEF